MLTIHFNALMIIGLCMLPGSFILAFLVGMLGAALGMEMGALAPMAVCFFGTLIPGLAMIFIGIGQNIG